MARAKDEDPLKLKRERPGRYVTADRRFAVEGATGGSWYLIHNERQNELGLPLMEGPLPTLEDARAALADAASGRKQPAQAEPPAPLKLKTAKTPPESSAPAKAARKSPKSEPEAPPEPAWLGGLQPADRAEARRLLALLDRLGIEDPSLARREIEGNVPELARLLLARRVRAEALDPWQDPDAAAADALGIGKRVRRHLRAALEPDIQAARAFLKAAAKHDGIGAFARLVAIGAAATVFEVLESEGRTPPAPGQPGWRLVEVNTRGDATDRQIIVEESDLLEP